ncbi:2-isopropylmalate synthase, partial [Candidatus Pelagibacter sp.]|nr:2-isopropylmalate synthase [Candidatus Pelagibacter sp.]
HDGYGTFTSIDGSEYVGEWKESERHGYGTFSYPDGSEYVGEWKESERNSQGTLINKYGKKKG